MVTNGDRMSKITGKTEEKMANVSLLNRKKCDELITKAKILSKAPELESREINRLEKELSVVLPEDFKYISNQYDYEYIDFFDFYSFATGIINQTKGLRKSWELPQKYLVLSEDDVSVLLLKTISVNQSEVILCDEPDFFNLCAGKPMEYNPTIFKNFTDFFEFLLNEEERMQAEDD